MKARCLCPYGDGSPSSHCWCIDMTAAWFHGAAKKPLVLSVNWNGTVSHSFLPLLHLTIVSHFVQIWVLNVRVCVCVCVCLHVWVCASAAAEHTNQQEVLIHLCSVFSHNLRENEQEQKWKKGNKSVRVCLPCWFEMKAHCATSSTLKSEMSLLARPREREEKERNNNSRLEFCPPFFCLVFFPQIGTVVFEEIKKDFCLTWTFRN